MLTPPQLPTGAQIGLSSFQFRERYAFFTGGPAPGEAVTAWNGHMKALLEEAQMKARVADYLQRLKSHLETFGVASVN